MKIEVETKVGPLVVLITDSNHACVRANGPEDRIQVGTFAYRVNLFFVRVGDEWIVDPEFDSNNVYHTEGKKYWTAPAKTIKAKIVAAAHEALLQALKNDPMALYRLDVENAQAEWGRREREFEALRDKLDAAQVHLNNAEKAFYAAMDRETEAEIAFQIAQVGK